MWTPRPVSPLRYAGSVATSVLPSPVAISAIFRAWSTMPRMSWTSKWRIRTVRRAASRQTANASGRSSSSGSPSVRRLRNSSDLARSPAASSACAAGSSALIAWTAGCMRLTSRSCLVPKIARRTASIISIDYGTRAWPGAISAPAARGAEQLTRVAARGVRDARAAQHPRDLLDARLAREELGAHAGAARPHALGDAQVVMRARRDRRQVGHAEDLSPLRGAGELLRHHGGDPPADARVHLVEDHRGHAVGLGQHRLEREHRARELAAGRHARERAELLARVRREPELRAVEAARRDIVQGTALEGDPEHRALHPEGAQLALDLGRQALARGAATLGELVGGLGELGVQLGQEPLLLRQDLLVTPEAVELGRRPVAECKHRLLRVAVLALEPRQRVQALVDRLEPPGLHAHGVAERPDPCERLVELDGGRVERLHGPGEGGVEAPEVGEEPRGPMDARRRRALVVRQKRGGLADPAEQALRVLAAAPLPAQLLLLAGPEAGAIELGDLEAQLVLALRPVPLRRARALDRLAGRPVLRDEGGDALAEVLGVGEPIEQLELARGLEEPLVLVLAVDLDEVVAEPLEQRHGHRRVVDAGPIAAPARELAAHDELALLEGQPPLVQDVPHPAPGLGVEDRLHGGGLGVGADHVGLGAGAPP